MTRLASSGAPRSNRLTERWPAARVALVDGVAGGRAPKLLDDKSRSMLQTHRIFTSLN